MSEDLNGAEASQNGVTGDVTHDDAERTSQDALGTSEEQPTDDDTGDGDDEGRPGRREAKYRTERNEARAEVNRLAGVVEGLQRQIIAGIASNEALKPEALFASGVKVSDLLNDEGAVDADKVRAAVAEARKTLGIPRMKPSMELGRAYLDDNDGLSAQQEFENAFGPRAMGDY